MRVTGTTLSMCPALLDPGKAGSWPGTTVIVTVGIVTTGGEVMDGAGPGLAGQADFPRD